MIKLINIIVKHIRWLLALELEKKVILELVRVSDNNSVISLLSNFSVKHMTSTKSLGMHIN